MRPAAPLPIIRRPPAGRDTTLHWLLDDIAAFSRVVWPAVALRRYQRPAARAIVHSALAGDGATLTVTFARQSGKDELLAQAIAFLLIRRQRVGGEIVVAAPSLVPQGQITRERVEARLRAAAPFAPNIESEGGSILRVGRALVRFVSAGPTAQVRGATASLLLIANEAQDMEPDHWDAVFDPMGASTNAPTVFAGTVWTRRTLLARATDQHDARTQHFIAPWQVVARELPAYGERVRQRIATLGPNHPFIRTEYCLQPLDDAGLFLDAAHQRQMHGDHPRLHRAHPGHSYALLLDVAGEEMHAADAPPDPTRDIRRDSTVLTVIEIVSPKNAVLPTYQVVDRRVWTGENHLTLAAEIATLARHIWSGRLGECARVVVDATGIGHGLATMLRAALPTGTVVPFVFTAASKSALGWNFLAATAAGRFRDYADDGAPETRWFWQQVQACTFTVHPGVGRLIAWSVPDPALHDDLLISAALVTLLDPLDWRPRLALGRTEG